MFNINSIFLIFYSYKYINFRNYKNTTTNFSDLEKKKFTNISEYS